MEAPRFLFFQRQVTRPVELLGKQRGDFYSFRAPL